ncbi:MAG TPA: cell division protein ZapA [Casimicrobiaceae bacterium]|nr:cell division protein ZapA [Casimicrobiaceae bacterium]
MKGERTLQLDVSILGRDYRIACDERERDALLTAVAHLDSRMREIRDAGKVTGVDRIAVMAALNITHDLLRERTEFALTTASPIDASDTRRRISALQGSIDSALAEQDKLF